MSTNGYGKSVSELAGVFGHSRQNYYQRFKRQMERGIAEEGILRYVRMIRSDQKRIGTLKLHWLINSHYGQGTIGRDALYRLLGRHNMLIRHRKRYRPKQTDGNGQSIYLDLRKGLEVSCINKLWSSDITYLSVRGPQRHLYLCCIVDEYSHLIVGYHLSTHMRAEQIIQALKQATQTQLPKGESTFKGELILHTDRGGQFKSKAYIDFTDDYGIRRSMCAAGKSYENPVAERLNGILKTELLEEDIFEDLPVAQQSIDRAIRIYNEQRPHLSCDMLTPKQAHDQASGPLKKRWRQRKKAKPNKTSLT